jgi:hypothetical protein
MRFAVLRFCGARYTVLGSQADSASATATATAACSSTRVSVLHLPWCCISLGAALANMQDTTNATLCCVPAACPQPHRRRHTGLIKSAALVDEHAAVESCQSASNQQISNLFNAVGVEALTVPHTSHTPTYQERATTAVASQFAVNCMLSAMFFQLAKVFAVDLDFFF